MNSIRLKSRVVSKHFFGGTIYFAVDGKVATSSTSTDQRRGQVHQAQVYTDQQAFGQVSFTFSIYYSNFYIFFHFPFNIRKYISLNQYQMQVLLNQLPTSLSKSTDNFVLDLSNYRYLTPRLCSMKAVNVVLKSSKHTSTQFLPFDSLALASQFYFSRTGTLGICFNGGLSNLSIKC